jgi:hypothetical protein
VSKNDDAYQTIKWAAENDKYYRIRQAAIGYMNSISKEKESDLKPLMTKIFQFDKKTTTRAEALEFLNTHYANDPALEALNEKALMEPSYAIDAEALDYYVKKDPKLALEKAKPFEKESGKTILYTLSGLYGNHGSEDNVAFFHTNLKNFGGFEMITFMSNYIKLAKRCDGYSCALTAARDFESIAKDGGRFTKSGAIKGLKDLLAVWTKKETDAKAASMNEKDLKTITETKDIIAGLLKGVS